MYEKHQASQTKTEVKFNVQSQLTLKTYVTHVTSYLK